ncbi:hypothetical protein EFR01_17620 [Sinorhizobium fredii]|nr:hypothetical protein EFR01_17620 [Sinorhizobium fredii]GLS11756.1 hypothetical protein GCM10007864_53880 [Sinorhizobium fredii]
MGTKPIVLPARRDSARAARNSAMLVMVFISGPSNPPGRRDTPRSADMAPSQLREKAIAQILAANLYLVRRKNTNGIGPTKDRRASADRALESRKHGAR